LVAYLPVRVALLHLKRLERKDWSAADFASSCACAVRVSPSLFPVVEIPATSKLRKTTPQTVPATVRFMLDFMVDLMVVVMVFSP